MRRYKNLYTACLGAYLLILLVAGASAENFRDCDACPPMRIVPAGSFLMGSMLGEAGRPEGPVQEVAVRRAFALAETETTVGQFRAFVEDTGHRVAKGCRVFLDGNWQNSARHDWRDPGPGLAYGDDYPVVCVSWDDATAYTQWLSQVAEREYRLPSETEWEYAVRSRSDGLYGWGSNPDTACAHANVYDQAATEFAFPWPTAACDDGFPSLAPVASFPPNAFGLYDLHGNVWEWVADCYLAPYAARDDRQGPLEVEGNCERRSVRGGSWMTRISRQRAAFRGRDPASARMAYFGFRVAAEPLRD